MRTKPQQNAPLSPAFTFTFGSPSALCPPPSALLKTTNHASSHIAHCVLCRTEWLPVQQTNRRYDSRGWPVLRFPSATAEDDGVAPEAVWRPPPHLQAPPLSLPVPLSFHCPCHCLSTALLTAHPLPFSLRIHCLTVASSPHLASTAKRRAPSKFRRCPARSGTRRWGDTRH